MYNNLFNNQKMDDWIFKSLLKSIKNIALPSTIDCNRIFYEKQTEIEIFINKQHEYVSVYLEAEQFFFKEKKQLFHPDVEVIGNIEVHCKANTDSIINLGKLTKKQVKELEEHIEERTTLR